MGAATTERSKLGTMLPGKSEWMWACVDSDDANRCFAGQTYGFEYFAYFDQEMARVAEATIVPRKSNSPVCNVLASSNRKIAC